MKRILFTFLFFIFSFSLFAQQHVIDSIKNVIKSELDDTNKLKSLTVLLDKLLTVDQSDTALVYAIKTQKLAEKIDSKIGLAKAYHNMGLIYNNQANYTLAIEYHNKALALYKETGYKAGVASSLGNIGNVYSEQGNYPQALNYYLDALTLHKEIGNKRGMSNCMGNIGNIYDMQEEYSKAISYDSSALVIDRELKDDENRAFHLGNIGVIYNEKGNYEKALECQFEALKIVEKMGDKEDMANDYGNIGNVYDNQGHPDKALECDFKALSLFRQVDDKVGVANNQGNIGIIYIKQRNYKLAKAYTDSALALSKIVGEKEEIKSAYGYKAAIDSANGDYKAALDDFKMFVAYKDSMMNEANTKKTVQAEMNYQFEQKQALEKAEQDKKDAVTAADKRKQNIVTSLVAIGLLLVLVFAFVLLNRFRVTNEQKKIIEEQKLIVEEKNKDITDSIHYASRIQRALLTTDSYIGNQISEYFILFKPRDIVSGDFYWANALQENGKKKFLICAGDCTGHGVPGAFMSLLNISMLNETTIEKGIHNPAAILDDVREHIIRALNSEGTDTGSKDGMDCVLCSFDFENKKIDFACANNPLVIIRDKQCIEFKADKMPVGVQSESHIPFTLQSAPIQKGDMVFLFTDGYADQFGGPKGKKFKYKQLQQLLIDNSQLTVQEQKWQLEKTFEEWKGSLEQVDDVLIIGIRV
jgi:serine phosphatase RsbU (regulator of sigma subunit)